MAVLNGLSQHDYPLTVQHIVGRLRSYHADRTCTTALRDGFRRVTYGQMIERVDRLARALRELGIGEGDRVASLAWNTQEHVELYLAVPAIGAVLHTLNPRLHANELRYIVEDADDAMIIADASLAEELVSLGVTNRHRRLRVLIGSDAGEADLAYDELLVEGDRHESPYPRLEDSAAGMLCYTSGTTGRPKGVLYSHRSMVLHALMLGVADVLGISGRDRVMPIVPMFHAGAWGIPYTTTMLGADLILPNRFLDPRSLAQLIERERPTVSAGVATVWMGLLEYVDEHATDLSSLRLVVSGGAPMPRQLMEGFEERHGVYVVQAWGMTETGPFGAIATPPGGVSAAQGREFRTRTGRAVPLLGIRIVDEAGEPLPWNDEAVGELEIKGPWVASAYFGAADDPQRFRDGWLSTGDVARVNERGYFQIIDRTKDLIKSGGEWISSVRLENELMAHPAVIEAAVVARPDPRWNERPLAFVVGRGGSRITEKELRAHLEGRVPKWWMPDEFRFVAKIPKTSVGKFDKKRLREAVSED